VRSLKFPKDVYFYTLMNGTFSLSLAEILNVVIRTLIVYVCLVGGIMLFGKKELSQLSVIDLVLVLLISNSVQNAMVGPSTSLTAGLVSAFSLFGLNWVLKNIVFKYAFARKIVEGDPVTLIAKGNIIEANVRREKITMNELIAAVREHGVDDIKDVQLALLETDGNISVLSADKVKETKYRRKKRAPVRIGDG
jgi:uncharacterized membrane protein YcaP (DUF421 family)